MASGRISSTFYNAGGAEYQFILDWSSSSSPSSNSSTVYVDASVYCPYKLNIKSRTDNSITIDGETFVFSSPAIAIGDGGGTAHLTSVSKTVYHNSDGSKSINISGSFNVKASFEGNYVGTASASGTATLDNIAKTSYVSCSTSAIVGQSASIVISASSTGLRHTIRYSFCGRSGTIADKTSSTNIQWTIPESFATYLGDSTYDTCTIYCDTYSGSAKIGTDSDNMTIRVDSSIHKPTVTATIKDVNPVSLAITKDENTLIRYISNAQYSIGGTPSLGSSGFSSYTAKNGSTYIYEQTGTFNAISSGDFTFTAIDNRGFYGKTEVSASKFINYVKLTTSVSGNTTTDGTMTLKLSGNFFNGTIGTTKNTLTVSYRYKAESDADYSDWVSATATYNGNTYTATVTLTGLDYQTSYIFQSRAVDIFMSVSSDDRVIRSWPVFDWSDKDFNANVPVTYTERQTENNRVYYLSGAAKALENAYGLSCTVTPGANFSSATLSATLVGGTVRCYMVATRSSAVGRDDAYINDTVLTVTMGHGGKIRNAYGVSFGNGYGGITAGYTMTNVTKPSSTSIKFDVRLVNCDAGTSSSNFAAYFAFPVTLNLNKF